MKKRDVIILSPNDKILIQTGNNWDLDVISNVVKHFSNYFPNNEIICVPSGLIDDISIIRASKPLKECSNDYFY